MSQQLLLPSNMKSYVGVQLTYLHLTLTISKGQSQGHAHFDDEYLGNGNTWCKNYYYRRIVSHMRVFDWYVYI